MDDGMMSKLSGILDDPQAMEKIKSIAQSLGGMGDPSPVVETATASSGSDSSSEGLLSGLNMNIDTGRAVALLEALRPFMRQSRRPKVNTAIKAVQVMSVLSKIK